MVKYEISVKKPAIKELENIPKKELQKLVKKIQTLTVEPRPKGTQKLKHKEQDRIRQGNYRDIY